MERTRIYTVRMRQTGRAGRHSTRVLFSTAGKRASLRPRGWRSLIPAMFRSSEGGSGTVSSKVPIPHRRSGRSESQGHCSELVDWHQVTRHAATNVELVSRGDGRPSPSRGLRAVRLNEAHQGQPTRGGEDMEPFTVHDLRRTGSTILNELGFNSDRIEKCLAHKDGRSSRGVYNKAEYGEQRRHMLPERADMIDALVAGKSHTPTCCRRDCQRHCFDLAMKLISTATLAALPRRSASSASCSRGQRIADSFLQTRSRPPGFCRSASKSPCRAS